MNIDNLTGIIIGCAMDVHKTLGPGYLESVYENALSFELSAHGVQFQRQVPISVIYKNHAVGNFVADLVIENCLIIELKATQNLHDHHGIQLVNYLTATGIDNGLLFNFGAASLQIRRKHRIYTPSSHPNSQSC